MNIKQLEENVMISIPKAYVPHLLGALRLGLRLENWCASLCMTEIGTYDSWSRHWSGNISHMINSTKEQTGVQDEFKAYGCSEGWLDEMSVWVDGQCRQNTKRFEESEKLTHKDHLQSCKG